MIDFLKSWIKSTLLYIYMCVHIYESAFYACQGYSDNTPHFQRNLLPHQWRSGSALKTGKMVMSDSILGRPCRLSVRSFMRFSPKHL